jgi:hypothetical protein
MRLAATVIIAGLMAVPLAAQGRGRGNAGIPPGHMPPAGVCQVWFEGVPPGRQPGPMNCRDAERVAQRNRYARVIYGNDRRYDDRYDNRSGGPYDDRYAGRYDDRYDDRYNDAGYWDPAPYYRQDNRRYQPRRMGRNDRIYRGTDNRYYCRRDDGTSGLIIGGISGGVLGNIIAPGGSKVLGTIIGAGAGAAIGRAVDRGDIVCR